MLIEAATKLVRYYQGTTGLKTGTTDKAGHCISASAQRDGTHLVAVVLGSDTGTNRFEGAKAMLNWGFANFVSITPGVDKALITDVHVNRGVTESLSPVLPEIGSVLVPKGEADTITQEVQLAVDVEAPVEEGQVLGTMTLRLGDELLGSYSLCAPQAVAQLTLKDVFLRILKSLA